MPWSHLPLFRSIVLKKNLVEKSRRSHIISRGPIPLYFQLGVQIPVIESPPTQYAFFLLGAKQQNDLQLNAEILQWIQGGKYENDKLIGTEIRYTVCEVPQRKADAIVGFRTQHDLASLP